MYFFFVFFGYFKKRCYFCNRLAEMASKAMAKSYGKKQYCYEADTSEGFSIALRE